MAVFGVLHLRSMGNALAAQFPQDPLYQLNPDLPTQPA